jgi:hypothetical protein
MQAKARECLAAHGQWEAALKARTAEVDRWDAASKRLTDIQRELAERIAEQPAHTMAGLRAKLDIINAEPLWAEETGITESALEDVRRINPHAQLSPPLAA